MKSKLIIGIPLAFIAVMIVRNYFTAPPVAFKNIRGHYMSEGGPFQGCVQLIQPGAGVKVMGFFSAAAAQVSTTSVTGEVRGNVFRLQVKEPAGGGKAELTVGDGVLSGTWLGPASQISVDWHLKRVPGPCF